MVDTLLPPLPSLEDPEPVAPVPLDRRGRGWPDALVTMLVCLVLWSLLFAPVLERNARSGPVGARRTVALAVLKPIGALSEALSVDGASDAMMRALGRDPDAPPGGSLELPAFELPPLPPLPADDETRPPPSVASPAPSNGPSGATGDRGNGEEEATEPGEATGLQPIRLPTTENKLRVVVVGDSLSQGLGPEVEGAFDADTSRVLSLGRQSTGLARRDYFNWQAAMRQVETEFRPDLAFVLLGSNDNQAQIAHDGLSIPVGSHEWVEAYRDRAAAFLAEATSAGTRVVWVGIPVVQERQRWDFYRRVNQIYAEVAAADPLAIYLDAWRLFEGRDGYTAYLRNERGIVQEMRAGDGLHFTPAGYTHLARMAIRAAADAFGLPQRAVTFRI